MKLTCSLFLLCTLAASGPLCAQSGPIGACDLPADPGPCDGVFPRWFHNAATGQCETFIFGGCGGNANNFETLVECQQACVDVCNLPADAGPCDAVVPRWFHNAATGQCEMFIWGGCGGNANNFETLFECQQACLPVCTFPPDPGPCEAAIPRWFFNATSGKCEQFIYGGCLGNGNNFETLEACQSTCVVPLLVQQYSCVNPTGSLLVLSGAPLLGTTYTVGVDDPVGTAAAGAFVFIAVSTQPDPAFPCGTPLPGLGMYGPFGELLIGVLPPDPIATFAGQQLWQSPGTPVPVVLPIPPAPSLAGKVLYLQGLLAAPSSGALTEGQKVTLQG